MPVVIKRILAWGLLAFLIYFLAFRPEAAADLVQAIGGALVAMAQGLGDFLTGLMG